MPLNILVVEDNRLLARNLADAFGGLGHATDFAANGEHGLVLALEHPYDVLVLDLALPGIDGLEVCRQLRARLPRRLPVLMLTARDTLQDKLHGFDAGADDYLVKPFAMEELLARCQALALRHRDYALAVGSLQIDRRAQAVTRAGQPATSCCWRWRRHIRA